MYVVVQNQLDAKQPFMALQMLGSRGLVGLVVLIVLRVLWKDGRAGFSIIHNFLSESVSPFSLAIFRIGFFGLINGMYWYQLQNAAVMASGTTEVIPLPFSGWYDWLLPMDYGFYRTVYCMGTAMALLSMLGVAYRQVAWLNIFFCFYLIGAPMLLGKLFFMQIWFWGCCLLAFAPAADALSVDALLARWRNGESRPGPSARYGMALKWLWLHLGIIYFFSAFHKLWDTGLAWALSDSMINQMHVEWLTNYEKVPALRLDSWPWLAHAGGLFVIIIELVFILLIIVRRTRWFAVIGGLSIHWGAAYFLHLSMGDLQFMYLSIVAVIVIPFRDSGLNQVSIPSFRWNKTHGIGAFLLSVNVLFGLFNIPSWPFSAYPSHSAYIGPTFTRVEFDLAMAGIDRHGLDSMALASGFRKDNYYNMSDAALSAYERGDTVEMAIQLKLLWANWLSNNPGLSEMDPPCAYLLETPVHPDRWRQELRREVMRCPLD
jgi:hypothetical protein